jgi:acyclic terpene utilization AtuA family protein
MKRVRVGVGAGFSGDRLDAALPLVERGEIGYLVFECLAERTIALAQKDRMRDAARGYHPFLEERLSGARRQDRQQHGGGEPDRGGAARVARRA